MRYNYHEIMKKKSEKTYHIVTFGCQMNKSDSERVAAVLDCKGYKAVNLPETADLVVINSCSVRQTAINRIWGYLRKFEEIKKSREISYILTGCILPEDKEKLGRNFDLVFDIKNLKELENYVTNLRIVTNNTKTKSSDINLRIVTNNTKTKSSDINVRISTNNTETRGLDMMEMTKNNRVKKNDDEYFEILPKYTNKYQAFVPIMTGCNNFCAYCAVPYTRGREESRTVESILTEIRNLAANGWVEITLLGQNVNSYNPTDQNSFSTLNPFQHNFAKLLWEINQIDGLNRIWFTAAHPKDMADEVIAALALDKMANYLHLALQSGSDEVLARMNRRYTADDYLEIIKKVRAVRPEISLGTDIIVGFPGETERDFQRTLDLYQEVQFDISFHAMYSPRSGTAAAKLTDDVSIEEKKQRWHRLQALMEEITLKKNQKYVGQTLEVLVDKHGDGWNEGNSREMKRVRFTSNDNMTGKLVLVNITRALEWLLEGDLIV